MRASRGPRLVRGALGASLATFVALLSHVAAGADMPGWLGIAVPWVLSVTVCTLLAGRRLSLVRLTMGVAASQFLFHVLFVLGTVTPSGAAVSAGHHHHHVPAVMTLPVVGDHAAALHAGPEMWVWHAVAGLATVAVLYRGERAVLRLRQMAGEFVAWAARVIIRTAPTSLLTPAVPALTDTGARWRVAASPALSLVRRRGPPLQLAL